MRRVVVLLLLSLVASVAFACEQLIGASFSVTTDTCSHVKPPGAPKAPAGGAIELWVAATAINFGDLPDGGFNDSLGYDLDGLCTFHGQGPPCSPAPWTDAGVIHDGPNGQDNGIGRFVSLQQEIVGVQSLSTIALTQAIQADIDAPPVMLHISGYNGFPTSAVTVEWLMPSLNTSDAGSRWPADGGVGQFDYAGRWTAEEAYVNDSQLVAHFRNGPAIRVANVPLPTVDVTVVAQVVGNSLTQGADIVGWTSMHTMFATLPYFTEQINKTAACLDNPAYPTVKTIYCSIADVLADGGVSPSTICDGVSFAIHVALTPVVVGSSVAETLAPLCPPATDPSNDTCDHP